MNWNKAENITLQFILVLTCLLFPKVIAECGGTIKILVPKIVLFRSLQIFDGNTKCTWILKVASGQRIKATFDFFSSVSTEYINIFTNVNVVEYLSPKTKIPTMVSGTAVHCSCTQFIKQQN